MDHDKSREEETKRKPRKPYEAPRIVDSATFETLALTCSFAPSSSCEFIVPPGPTNS